MSIEKIGNAMIVVSIRIHFGAICILGSQHITIICVYQILKYAGGDLTVMQTGNLHEAMMKCQDGQDLKSAY